ncbi:MAG: host attachment protein [Gammaproteobacteria bacterium]|nr:host attachment protein [Gammaproteobacteria bacterium]
MSKTWILVAESSRAKIYEVDKNESKKILRELTGFTHSVSRNHKQQLSGNLQKESRHSLLTTSLDTHKGHERVEFARAIGEHLNSARNKGKFNKLILMSPPGFLGDLRKNLSNETNKFVISEVDKNLVRHNIKDIEAHLPAVY